MQSLLQIVLHQSVENLSGSGNSFWWDLSNDFILPIGLAVGAAYTAYFIFVKETKRDKANEEDKKQEERLDKLIFFSALVDSALRSSVQQKDNIKEHIRKIKQNNVDFQLMSQVSLYDLKRITEVLDLEDYLLSYTNYYNIDRMASVKEFKETVAAVDFLYEVFQQIIEQLRKAQMYDYERKTRMQTLFASGYNIIGQLMIMFQKQNPPSQAAFLQLYQNFAQNHPGNNYDVTFYYQFFFVPYNDFCTNYLASGAPVLQEILDLAVYTRDGKQVYEQIKSENDIIKESLIGDFKSVYRTILELRQNSKNLLEDF